jgi:hypothetical protein
VIVPIAPAFTPDTVSALHGLVDPHEAFKGPWSVEIGAGVHTGYLMRTEPPEAFYEHWRPFPLDLEHAASFLATTTPRDGAYLRAGVIGEGQAMRERVEAWPLFWMHTR